LVSVSNTSNPEAGDDMAVRCADVMRGINMPLVVLLISSIELEEGDVVPIPTACEFAFTKPIIKLVKRRSFLI
jgi:hypothetical protein